MYKPYGLSVVQKRKIAINTHIYIHAHKIIVKIPKRDSFNLKIYKYTNISRICVLSRIQYIPFSMCVGKEEKNVG